LLPPLLGGAALSEKQKRASIRPVIAADGEVAGAPQWPQNFVPGGFSPAQDSQREAPGVPHWPQKRISSEFAAPQAAQSQAGIDLFSRQPQVVDASTRSRNVD
jgi:hypothetical protein